MLSFSVVWMFTHVRQQGELFTQGVELLRAQEATGHRGLTFLQHFCYRKGFEFIYASMIKFKAPGPESPLQRL